MNKRINPLHVSMIRVLMKKKIGRSQYLSIIEENGMYRVNFRRKYQENFFVKIEEGPTSITATFIRDTSIIKEQKEAIKQGLEMRYTLKRNGIKIEYVNGFHQLTGNTWLLSDNQIKRINNKLEQLDEMEAICLEQ